VSPVLHVSGRLAWWGTAWLRGLVVTDLVIDALLADDATHVVAGLPGTDGSVPPARALAGAHRGSFRASVRSEFPWERLPMAQVEILQRLAEEPGLRITDLASRHRLATNTVSNLVQQMVLAGLVERRDDVRDRRAVTLQLTAAGADVLARWLHANNRRLDAALADLSVKDRGAIATALPSLSRLVQRLETSDETSLPVAQESA